jgi:hypothetical protein
MEAFRRGVSIDNLFRETCTVNGEETILMLTIFLIVGGMIFKWLDSMHKQRMAMIDKGVSATDLFGKRRPGDPLPVLKWGLLAVFVGLGLLAGIILHENYRVVEEATPVLGLIMGGVALTIYYGIASVRERRGE